MPPYRLADGRRYICPAVARYNTGCAVHHEKDGTGFSVLTYCDLFDNADLLDDVVKAGHLWTRQALRRLVCSRAPLIKLYWQQVNNNAGHLLSPESSQLKLIMSLAASSVSWFSSLPAMAAHSDSRMPYRNLPALLGAAVLQLTGPLSKHGASRPQKPYGLS